MDSQHSPGTALRANDADYVTWGARWRHRHTAHTTAGGNKGGVAAEWTYGDARGHTQPGDSLAALDHLPMEREMLPGVPLAAHNRARDPRTIGINHGETPPSAA